MSDRLTAYWGLPEEVRFCTRCVLSNQKPQSANEYEHGGDSTKETIPFDVHGVCLACRQMDTVNCDIDWERREHELVKLLDRYRRDDGGYDVLVPGSGGKDSAMASHLLKYKYGMHPLTVTWAPHLYTDIGWKNLQNWIHVGGFDNYLFTSDGQVHRTLTRLAFINLLHPFQPFIVGQKTFAPKMALKHGIKLVFYGESPGQYGQRVSVEDQSRFGDSDEAPGFRLRYDTTRLKLGGVPVEDLVRQHGLSWADLAPYMPADGEELAAAKIEFHFLGSYVKWIPQEAYYYATEYAGFQANSERSEGTYSKYSSLDDKIDGFNYWTTFVKFGIGRATYDACQEIHHGHITREEGVALVRRFDGEFPSKYFPEILEYLGLTDTEFFAIADRFRSPHLWTKENGDWKLRHQVS
ncbi:MAG: N-acetyl sugar amidotransferase [Chloroflexi bacterium]|nr:N-acetyl sugar amidotransferase [Chloroflexota bacterium]